MCSQRWAKLENFPPKFPFCYTPNKFQLFQKSDKKKKKKKTTLCSFSYLFPFHFKFSSSPLLQFPFFSLPIFHLFLASLFPFLLLFPLPSHFSLFLPLFLISPSFQNFPPNFPRVGDLPTSPTPSYTTVLACLWRYS